MSQVEDEGIKIIRETLAKNSVTNVEITHQRNVQLDKEVFTIIKRLGKEKLGVQITVGYISDYDDENKKKLTFEAERAARDIKQELRTRFSWEKDEVNISLHNGGWAECVGCGEEVEFPLRQLSGAFGVDAETSTPQPYPVSKQTLVDDLSEFQQIVARFYLLALLRRKCDITCPFQNI